MPGITDSPPPWSSDFDTLRREHLFRNPPKDTTPYPDLAEAFKPHIESFNAIFDQNGVLEHGLRDIGTKSFTDGDATSDSRSTLHLRVREYFVDKPILPSSNKFSTTEREIYPSECRERHCTYKGRFNVRLEYKVDDGDWRESVRNLGQLPLMLKVGSVAYNDNLINSVTSIAVQ